MDDTSPNGLGPGLYLIETPDPWTTALHRVVHRYLESSARSVLWIDALDNARLFARFEDPRDILDGRFAIAFDAPGHHELVRTLPEDLSPETDLIVLPSVTWLYEHGDLPAELARRYLDSTLESLVETAGAAGLPVLATGVVGGAFLEPARDVARTTVRVERTDHGYRFEPTSFETAVGWRHDHGQPTIPEWDGPANGFQDPPTTEELAALGFFPETI